MQRYSIFALARNALSNHERWQAVWRSPEPKPRYRVVIVGGGGHGLATAYYLAREHGITDVAVLEKGWLGGGNTARNTSVVRSNYLRPESAALYDHAVRLWEGLSAELNYNVMFSQRGLLHLAHSEHDLQEVGRRVHAIRMHGVDSELLTPAEVREWVPFIDLHCRFPVLGALLQRRGGTARHDAVAWGFARAADARGVDIIQNCEVTGFRIEDGTVTGVDTARGRIAAETVGVAAAGHSGVLAERAGFRLPVESVPLQALVSEPLKPVMDCVVLSNTIHAYLSQSDRGELVIGGGADAHVSYSRRGGFHEVDSMLSAIVELYPIFSRVKMMRQWAGVVDITPDRSPILSSTPVRNLWINSGWGTGGFKATPASGQVFARMLAEGAHNAITAPFDLARFATGALVDEGAAAAVAH